MAVIDSVKLPDNSTYDVADNYSGYQKATLTTPLTINGTQETTVEGALGGLNDYADALKTAISNENLVDNPFFTVNQRGTSGSYQEGRIADRWYAYGFSASNITSSITNNGVVIQSDGTHGWRVLQNIKNYKDLSGRKVTYSINVKSISSGSIRLFYAPSLNGINEDWVYLVDASTTGITSVTFTLPDLSSASGLCLMFQSDTPIDATIRAVKLEVGTVSTLANDVEPDYTTELLKCQWEYYRISLDSASAFVTVGFMADSTTFYGVINLPTPLKSAPTSTYSGVIQIFTVGGTENVTSLTTIMRSPQTITVTATIANALTVNSPAILMGGPSSYIDFSA